MSNVKESMLELTKSLPDECTWDDVMYQVYVRQKIESGPRDVEEERTISHEQVFQEFGNEAGGE